MYAEILPNVPSLTRTFHYAIPPELEDELRAGHLVVVPWGNKRIQGIVITLDDDAPDDVAHFKDVEDLIDPEPVLTHDQLELAWWLSRYYHAPLIDCVTLMLPPGLAKNADVEYSLIQPDAVVKGQNAQQIISLLTRRGPLRGKQLDRSMSRKEWRRAMRHLLAKGIVRRKDVLSDPTVRPRKVITVALTQEPQYVTALKRLVAPRQSKHIELLDYLFDLWPGQPSLPDLRYYTNATKQHLDRLIEDEWVELIPKESVVVCALSAESTAAYCDKHAFAKPHEVAVLQTLLEAEGVVAKDELRVDDDLLTAMTADDLIRVSTNPERLKLRQSLYELDAYLKPRREPQNAKTRVLDFLAENDGGPVELSWIYAETDAKRNHLNDLEELGLVEFGEIEVYRDSLRDREFARMAPFNLTEGQQRVWAQVQHGFDIAAAQRRNDPLGELRPFLLHGVTGSGKTEIYLRAVGEALERKQQAIVLIPEIALTPQTTQRFMSRFPGKVAVIHSKLSAGERYDTWRRTRSGLVDIIIGPRSALWSPLPNLGLIILDEEHDEAYKQSPPIEGPYYHARDVAVEYARRLNAVCLLGSATPDMVTYERAKRGRYHYLEMPTRIYGHGDPELQGLLPAALPTARIVDMRHELKQGNRSLFSRELHVAIEQTLQREEQVILFLNRRGQATFVFCRDCGHTSECPNCEIPFTYHRKGDTLLCHHCNTRRKPPEKCPKCYNTRIKFFGTGTERVEAEIGAEFPEARVLRLDGDAVRSKDSYEHILTHFAHHNADILIGTQMIAKGHDLPLVTLVGVISADIGLALPDYRASERTFQTLTQVAGRAGRSMRGGRVILQTYMPDHYVVQAAAEHDYKGFFQQELDYRRMQGYPPFGKLVRFLGRHHNYSKLEQEAQEIATQIRREIRQRELNSTALIGPAPAFFGRISGDYRWNLLLRGPNPAQVLPHINLPSHWSAEVDPAGVL